MLEGGQCMANTITGKIYFCPNVINFKTQTNTPVSGIPVALQVQGDTSFIGGPFNDTAYTAEGIVVLTDANGIYTFTGVPDGAYRIEEAAGYATDGLSTTADWSSAASISVIPQDPAITAISNPPSLAYKVNSLSPNTLFVTVSVSSSYAGKDF